MATKVGAKCFSLIEKWEGYKTRLANGNVKAYLDKLPRPALWSKGYKGLWTVGFGSTGPGITEGTVWTRAQAEGDVRRRIKLVETSLNLKQKQYGITLDQNQYDSMGSAGWNLGPETTLFDEVFRHLKAGDEDGAANAFLKYNHAGGRVVKGLTNRRKDERALFLEHTVATLYEASPRLTWSRRLRNFFGSLSIATYFTWDNLAQVKSFCTDHAGVLLLGTAVLIWLAFKAMEYFSVQDHFKGLWTPSGDVTSSAE